MTTDATAAPAGPVRPAPGVLTVPVTTFRDARDAIPRPRSLTYPELVAWLAPARPSVRGDVVDASRQQRATLARVLDAAIHERGPVRGGDRWQRELERVAFQTAATTEDPDVVAEALRARAAELDVAIVRQAKTALPCWSPAVYRPGRLRGADGVEAVTCLVLDHDDGLSIDEATAPWTDWPHLVHTSWSHTDERPKFRVVLVLAEPVPAAAWPRAWAWAFARAGGRVDPACKDPSRVYFLPAVPSADAPYEARVHEPGGQLLRIDWERLPTPASKGPTNRPPVPAASPPDDDPRRRRLVHLLRTDRGTRDRAAELLGAEVHDRRADKITCPSCGRPSVWFWLEPGAQHTAACKHLNSCAWRAGLDVLLDARGATP
jgi:hypothetical protein